MRGGCGSICQRQLCGVVISDASAYAHWVMAVGGDERRRFSEEYKMHNKKQCKTKRNKYV